MDTKEIQPEKKVFEKDGVTVELEEPVIDYCDGYDGGHLNMKVYGLAPKNVMPLISVLLEQHPDREIDKFDVHIDSNPAYTTKPGEGQRSLEQILGAGEPYSAKIILGPKRDSIKGGRMHNDCDFGIIYDLDKSLYPSDRFPVDKQAFYIKIYQITNWLDKSDFEVIKSQLRGEANGIIDIVGKLAQKRN